MPRKTDWLPCAVDDHGLNVAIKAHVLDDDRMRAAGFTDNRSTVWYYCANLGRDISFNVTIPKDGSRLTIDVIDEMFLQPYDYQAILRRNPLHPLAHDIYEAVEKQMAKLTIAGIISGHVPGDYI